MTLCIRSPTKAPVESSMFVVHVAATILMLLDRGYMDGVLVLAHVRLPLV
jgi:hypothetical protein